MDENRLMSASARCSHLAKCQRITSVFLCVSLQMFLVALSFAYFAKALSGSYMKSTITQLERRFDIPSYLIGVIDGSFEIGKNQMLMRQQTLSIIFRFSPITSGYRLSRQRCINMGEIILRCTVCVAIYYRKIKLQMCLTNQSFRVKNYYRTY